MGQFQMSRTSAFRFDVYPISPTSLWDTLSMSNAFKSQSHRCWRTSISFSYTVTIFIMSSSQRWLKSLLILARFLTICRVIWRGGGWKCRTECKGWKIQLSVLASLAAFAHDVVFRGCGLLPDFNCQASRHWYIIYIQLYSPNGSRNKQNINLTNLTKLLRSPQFITMIIQCTDHHLAHSSLQ